MTDEFNAFLAEAERRHHIFLADPLKDVLRRISERIDAIEDRLVGEEPADAADPEPHAPKKPGRKPKK